MIARQQSLVLLVDDEELIRALYSEFLEMHGYPVKTAATAKEALQILQEHDVRLLILDLNMPGTSGIELCRIVKREFPEVICYALTGGSAHTPTRELQEAGFSALFLKPVPVNDFLSLVRQGLEQEQTGLSLFLW